MTDSVASPCVSASFGQHLRQLRLRAGMTQEALAGRAGISTRTIQHLERGLGQPHRETTHRLIDAFGLTDDQSRGFETLAAPAPRRRRQVPRDPVPRVADLGDVRRDSARGGGERSGLSGLTIASGERQQVTVVVAEVVQPAMLFEALGLAGAVQLLDMVLAAIRAAIHQFRGTVTCIDHSGLTVLFGAALAEEQNAISACRAALAMLQAVRHLLESGQARPVVWQGVRVGVASGEVASRTVNAALSADYMVAGRPIHSASGLARLASPGRAWIERGTAALVAGQMPMRALRPIPTSGNELPVVAFELLSTWNDMELSDAPATSNRVLAGSGATPG